MEPLYPDSGMIGGAKKCPDCGAHYEPTEGEWWSGDWVRGWDEGYQASLDDHLEKTRQELRAEFWQRSYAASTTRWA